MAKVSPDKYFDLRFPTGGLNHRYGYQGQPPYTSPSCVNVRAQDTEEGRERGGQRPGLGRSHVPVIGGGNPVRMLQGCNVVIDDTVNYWQDDFRSDAMGSLWVAAPNGNPTIDTSRHFATGDDSTKSLGATITLTDPAFTSPFHVGVFVVPYLGAHRGVYRIYAMTSVTLTWGFRATITLGATVGAYSWTLDKIDNGVVTELASGSGTDTLARAGWFRMELTDLVSGTPTTYDIDLWWNENLLSENGGHTADTAGGTAAGFTMTPTASASPCQISNFRLHYNSATTRRTARNILVASANTAIYQEDRMGFMDTISVARTLASNVRIRAADRGQKLYIADRSNKQIDGTDGVVTAGVITSASVGNWATAHDAAGVGDLQIEITAGTGTVSNGVYAVTTIVTTDLTITGMTGTGNCTFRLGRGPKVYDPVAKTLTHMLASSGDGPLGCPLVVRFLDRLVWAGPGHEWFASRQGDPLDYDYGADAEDIQRAVRGTIAAGGTPGEPITALMPFVDDKLIFGCERSLWMMRGDPGNGIRVDLLSASVGVISGDAWCYGPNRELYFMDRNGLYQLDPDAATPRSLNEKFGRRLGQDVDPALYEVQLAHDHRDRGVHVFITAKDVRYSDLHAFVDVNTGALWPVRFGNTSAFLTTMEPTAVAYAHSPTPGESGIVLGCRDGALRYFRDLFETDEGTAITSLVEYGPLPVNPGFQGMMLGMLATLTNRSGGVRFRVRNGHTGESAALADHFASSAMSAGTNRWWPMRMTGGAFILALSNNENRSWGVETITVQARAAGKIRPG